MLKLYAFYRFIVFLNDNKENVLYICRAQRNQNYIDFPKSTINLTTNGYCFKST